MQIEQIMIDFRDRSPLAIAAEVPLAATRPAKAVLVTRPASCRGFHGNCAAAAMPESIRRKRSAPSTANQQLDARASADEGDRPNLSLVSISALLYNRRFS
jgi:hypothetical protein